MKADRYVSQGVPVIRGQNITATRSLGGEFVFVSDETAAELSSCLVFPGDLVFPHRGAIGEVGIVPVMQSGPASRFMLSTSLMKLTCNRDVADPNYVFYFFRSDLGRQEILKYASTVGTPGIGQPLASLRSMRLPLPLLTEQHRIVEVLGTLDDKIDSNNSMAIISEQLAVAMLEQFDAQITVAALASTDRTQVGTREFRSAVVDHYSLPAFDANKLPERTTGGSIKSSKFRVSGPSVLVSKLNPRIPRVWHAAPRPGVMSLASTEFVVLRPSNGITSEELWAACAARSFTEAIAELVTGTTGSHQRVRPEEIMQSSVVDVRRAPDSVRILIRDLVRRSGAARAESASLADLRDTLLGPLLSGELRVREASTLIEDAG
jgi:type I restriction enzyme, S subunit